MKKRYMPVTFSKDEINYLTLAIVLKVIDNVKDPEIVLFFRDYYLGTELFIEENYFLDAIRKIKDALSENTINSEFKKPLSEVLEVMTNTINSGVKFVEPVDVFKRKLSPYSFKVI